MCADYNQNGVVLEADSPTSTTLHVYPPGNMYPSSTNHGLIPFWCVIADADVIVTYISSCYSSTDFELGQHSR
jgi:hypothetical protein